MDSEKPILIGRITGIYGIKGWVKVKSYTRPPEKILSYTPWYIQRGDDLQEITVCDGIQAGKSLRAGLAGITDRDQARALIDSDIYIRRHQLEALPEGQFYQADLIGLQVVDTNDQVLGTLEEICETGANDVMVVQGERRHLIPLVWEHYLLDVDPVRGIIRVDWVEVE